MDFDQQRISARRHCRLCQRRHHVAAACGVARVGDDRQVRQLLEHRDGRNIESISQISVKRADAALTQNDIMIAARHDVFGGQQSFFNSRRRAAF